MILKSILTRVFVAVALIVLAWAGPFPLPLHGQASSAEDEILALIDLGQANDAEFYAPLDGEWFYFAEQLLQPTDVYQYILRDYNHTVQIPGSFKQQTGSANTYGTYATRVKIPDVFVGRTLAIYIPHQYSAYKMYVDRVEVASSGKVGTSSFEHVSKLSPQLGYVVPFTNELLLTLQVSSFEHQRGGFENSIYIGDASVVAKKFNTSIIWMLFVAGCIFIMGMFMILFAWFRRQERVFLIFGLFCICFSIRAFFAEPFFYTLTLVHIPYIWGTRIEYMFSYTSIFLLVCLVYQWYKRQFSKRILKLIAAILITVMSITLVTKPVVFQTAAEFVFLCAVIGSFYLYYVIYAGYKRENIRNLANIVGMILVMLGMFNDYLVNRGWIDSKFVSLSLVAVGLYVVIQVFIMSKSYATKVQETEQLNHSLKQLNATLDEQVHVRTVELRLANEKLAFQAAIDSLTGIYNRHRFNSFMQQTFQHALDNSLPLSIIIFDLDEFKKYNDHYGHIQGDALLKQVVSIVNEQLPANSLFARYGGEEFVIVLPNLQQKEAYVIAEAVRQAVEAAKLPHIKREHGIATISVGVAALEAQALYRNEVELIDAADQQLYRSKNFGRNQTSAAWQAGEAVEPV